MVRQGIVARLAPRSLRKPALWLLLAGSACLAAAGRLEADPYYTATYVGPSSNVKQQSGSLISTQTGVSYPFATITTAVTNADLQNLPGGTIQQGHAYPQTIPYTMSVQAINSSGTAIGAVPIGAGYSDPWEFQTLGYAVRSPDGHYSPFAPLINGNDQMLQPGVLYLSQSNQILINSYGFYGAGAGTSLLDVNTGVTTPIARLVSPAFASQFSGLIGEGIDDRGDILVDAMSSNGEQSTYILTPAGLAAPIATPEPASLLVFGLVAGAMGLRSVLRRRSE